MLVERGESRALDVIIDALRSHWMLLADTIDGLGYEPGEIRRDERTMKSAWELGREIVQLIIRDSHGQRSSANHYID